MKHYSFFTLLTVLFVIMVTGNSFSQDKPHVFAGVQSCKMCHQTEKQGQQFPIWKASKHSTAYQALLSDSAKAIAKAKGMTVEPSKAPECLKCHASGYNVDAALLGKNFKVDEGVQCETCHGAGTDYMKMNVMKSHEESIKAGLTVYTETEKFCVTCHNSESPTFKEFKFDEFWAKIKHIVPKPPTQ